MPRTRLPLSAELRRRLVELLVRASQTPEKLARKYEPSPGAIRNWVVQAARDDSRRTNGLTTDGTAHHSRSPSMTKALLQHLP